MTRHRSASRFLAFAVAVPIVAMLLAATALAAPSKPVLSDISPKSSAEFNIVADDVAMGTCVTFQVSLTNNTKTQMLGSANYTLDTDLTYGSAGCLLNLVPPAAGSATATGMPDDPIVELRDLNAGPDTKVTFYFDAFVPCATSGTTYDGFSVIAKQANNYSGDPGNNLTIDTASDFTVQSVGFCKTFGSTETAKGSIKGTQNNSTYTLEAVAASAGTLIIAKGVNFVDCTGYDEHTDTVTVDFTGAAEKILTFQFPNTNKEQKSAFRVCFSSPDDWTDRNSVLVTSPDTASLLADCDDAKDPTNLPCMLPVEIKGGEVTIKAWLRPGDPPARG